MTDITRPGLALHSLHRALCSLFQPDTDGMHVSKFGQLSQQTRRLDPMLFQCWSSAVGGGPILEQHWIKSSCLLGSTQVSLQPIRVLLARQPANHKLTIILEIESGGGGTYDVNHLQILTCEVAVSRWAVYTLILSGNYCLRQGSVV